MSNHPLSNISADAFRKAADIRDQIEALHAQLEGVLAGSHSGSAVVAEPKRRPGRPKGSGKTASIGAGSGRKATKRKGGKRKISPEGLERIRAAQRARWAKTKGKKS